MNTATMTIGNPKTGLARPGRSLEELVDRLMATLTFPAEPDPVAVVGPHHDVAHQRRGRLEELVDRLMATLTFRVNPEMTPVAASSDLVRDIHQSRRHRQEGNLDRALETLAGANPASAAPQHGRWAFTEWRQLVGRRFGHREVLVYSQETGRAAALVPGGHGGTLEVVAVLGMSWRPGKLVSRRSLQSRRSPVSSAGQAPGMACP